MLFEHFILEGERKVNQNRISNDFILCTLVWQKLYQMKIAIIISVAAGGKSLFDMHYHYYFLSFLFSTIIRKQEKTQI